MGITLTTGSIALTSGSLGSGPLPVVAPVEPTITNLAAHWDAQNFDSFTLSSNRISQWNDLSGNGRHLTQVTSGDQPLYETGVVNGFPGIRNTDAVDHLINTSFTEATDKTVISVIKSQVEIGIESPFQFENPGRQSLIYWVPGYGYSQFNSDTFGPNASVLIEDVAVVATIYFDSGNLLDGLRLFLNETELTGFIQHRGSPNNSATIGADFLIGNSSGFGWLGWVADTYIIEGLMDNTERDDLITFLKAKWSIA